MLAGLEVPLGEGGMPAHDRRCARRCTVASEPVVERLRMQAFPLRVRSGSRKTIKVSGKWPSGVRTSDKGCAGRRPIH